MLLLYPSGVAEVGLLPHRRCQTCQWKEQASRVLHCRSRGGSDLDGRYEILEGIVASGSLQRSLRTLQAC